MPVKRSAPLRRFEPPAGLRVPESCVVAYQVQRQLPVGRPGARVGARLQQCDKCRGALAEGGRAMERRGAVPVPGIGVGARLDQVLERRSRGIVLRRIVQRRLA